ncbi:MAG: hypothetical protein JMN25_07045 [gamma proteobacterium endosymbiont of Lamellibrachia anaximandri]|nr:hypothetical protein [gamma proteobacterium endosymbiont of Lamellibrachia anaximandri]
MTQSLYLIIILMFLPLQAQAESLEIFELKGRTPQEMIPLLKPFLGPEGTIEGMHNKLIIRTSPERMVEIKKIINEFDHAPRRMLIHVREQAPSQRQRQQVELHAGNDSIRIGTQSERGSIKRYTTQSHTDASRTIQTLEGQSAFIKTGIIRPVESGTGVIAGPIVGYQSTTEYQDISSGFHVTPQIIGDRIRLEITNRHAQPGRRQETVRQTESATVVSVKPGEWIPLSSTGQAGSNSTSNIGMQAKTRASDEHSTWIKVELLGR